MVDSNVLLDILERDPTWFTWSRTTLDQIAAQGPLAINPIVYAEISVGFARIEQLHSVVPERRFERLPLPWRAAFVAGTCFVAYRRAGGTRRSPLPDFYIGAHAVVDGMRLLTRDAVRYRSYFPTLDLIAP